MVRGSYVESQGIRYTDQFLDLDGRIKKSEKEAQLPKDAIPVDFDPDTRIISAPTPHENHEELRTAPPTSRQEFVSQLPDWDADLLENTEGDDQSPVSNLKDVLQTSKPILLVSDGGVRSTSGRLLRMGSSHFVYEALVRNGQSKGVPNDIQPRRGLWTTRRIIVPKKIHRVHLYILPN